MSVDALYRNFRGVDAQEKGISISKKEVGRSEMIPLDRTLYMPQEWSME